MDPTAVPPPPPTATPTPTPNANPNPNPNSNSNSGAKWTAPPAYLVAVGVTTTSDETHANPAPPLVARDRAELVELSFVVVATPSARDVAPGAPMMMHWAQLLARPQFTPWSPFCARVSGFAPDHVAAAKHSFASALLELDQFVQTYFIAQNKSFAFVTHGEYDIRYHLVREAKEKGVPLPSYFSVFFDIASQVRVCSDALSYVNDEFAAPGTTAGAPATVVTPTVTPIIPHNMSLVSLCHQVGIQHEGRLNSGIDSALMIAKICIAVLNASQNWIPSSVALTSVPPAGYLVKREVPFTNPTNTASLLLEFYSSESKIVFITGISFSATVTDLQTWLRQVNLVPGQLWMLKNNEGRPEGSGYIVFSTHADAHSCIVNLNGRSMDGRGIQVGPASEREFDLTRPFRAPFPTVQEVANTSMAAPDTKPGDWFCSTCQFHNFANRVLCKQCNNPPRQSSGLFSSPKPIPGGHPGGMKPGDWICTNVNCRFQNFQSRMECMKCRGPRPGTVAPPPSSTNGASSAIISPIAPGGGVVATAVGVASFKPGDWVCSSCHKHNFASRSVCMQCAKPNDMTGILQVPPGSSVASGPMGTGWRATDRPGDWTCPSPSCRYHNYASRFECLRCGTRKQ
ncbi:hypothetical protein BDR26DRAFT_825383 [Obelidium mucronatum]|nr:hypothetical protein BDR26DRAFT_825383 [Obelidium mucronatum]